MFTLISNFLSHNYYKSIIENGGSQLDFVESLILVVKMNFTFDNAIWLIREESSKLNSFKTNI